MSKLAVAPGAYRLGGSGSLVYSEADHPGTSREHTLRVPLQDLVPVAETGVIGSWREWGGSKQEVWTLGDGAQAVRARIAFDQAAESLIQLTGAGARGETVTYYPDVDDPAWSYDVEITEPRGPHLARLSEVSGVFQEFDAEITFRKSDGSAFGPEIFSGLLVHHRAGWDLSRATVTGGGGSYTDIAGASQTAPGGTIRDAHYVTDEDGNWVRTTRLSTADGDSFALPFTHVPRAGSLYMKFVERVSASGTQVQIGLSGTGAKLTVDADASNVYSATHDNGTSTATASASTGASSGEVVELNVRLADDGSLTLEQALDGGAVESSTSGAVDFADAWQAEDIGLTVTSAAADWIDLLGAPASRPIADMRRLAAA